MSCIWYTPKGLFPPEPKHYRGPKVKVAIIGARAVLVKGEPNVSYICSRYYCAPELIFGVTEYTTAIDIWSTGCVMAKLLLGQEINVLMCRKFNLQLQGMYILDVFMDMMYRTDMAKTTSMVQMKVLLGATFRT
ncbi:hypothetical protein ACFE04_000639 [Oxalis oulophora]